MDRVEGVHPLALGTQILFEEAEVFYRKRQLLGIGLQELQFFAGPIAGSRISQEKDADGCLGARHRKRNDLGNSLGGKKIGVFGNRRFAFRYARLGLFQHFRDIFGDRGESSIAQEVGRKPNGVSRHQLATFEQTEPDRPDMGQVPQIFHRGLNDIPVQLSAGHTLDECLQGVQPSRVGSSLAKDYQQHSDAKRNFGGKEGSRRLLGR